MTLHLEFDKFTGLIQNRWDSSSLDAFTRCPRYYQYSYIEGLVPVYDDRRSLEWGKAYHAVMEIYDRLVSPSYEMPVDDALEAALEFAEQYRGQFDPEKDNKLTFENLQKALVWWASEYRQDYLKTALMMDGTPAIEVYFQLPIPGQPGKTLSGRIDRIAVDGEGRLWVIDRKTTKQALGSFYFRGFKPSAQGYIYVKAMQQLGFDPAGFLIDAVEVQVGGVKFDRKPITYSQDEVDEFMVELGERISLADAYAAAEFFPRTMSSCKGFGNKGCIFQDLCGTSHSARDFLKLRNFKLKEKKDMKLDMTVLG